jgi:protein-tyrosine phosphatase
LYYNGISRTDDVLKLRLGDTKILLLEMPMGRWSDYTVRELIDLAGSGSITLVLAHIERYLHFQKKSTLEALLYYGALMQVNASFFLSIKTKHKALKMMQEQQIHLIGSDCHNLTSRRPRLDEACEVIRKKFGDEFLENMNRYHQNILEVEKCAANI